MPMAKPLAVLLGTGLLLTMLLSAGPASGATSANQYLRALVRQTNSLPPGAVSTAQRKKLRRHAAHAVRVAKRRPCSAVADMARFRRVLRGIRVKSGRRNKRARERLIALGPSSLKASQKLLSDRRTRRCGGGVRPSTLADVKATVLGSDENGLSVRMQLPVLRFVEETGGGRTWTKLVLPDTDSPGAPGTPGIPVVSNTFGVPDGATVKVQTGRRRLVHDPGRRRLPQPARSGRPERAAARTSWPGRSSRPPFQVERAGVQVERARSRAACGRRHCSARRATSTIGNLQVPAAQYNPATKRLKVLKSVVVNIAFEGGPNTFNDELASPWEHSQRNLAATLLNAEPLPQPSCSRSSAAAARRCSSSPTRRRSPRRTAFATAKRAQGMRTSGLPDRRRRRADRDDAGADPDVHPRQADRSSCASTPAT